MGALPRTSVEPISEVVTEFPLYSDIALYPDTASTTEITSAQLLENLPEGFTVRDGRLFHFGVDLLSLVNDPIVIGDTAGDASTPLYVRRLPALRNNLADLHCWFEVAKAATNYPGDLMVAYASKANPSEPVVRTLLRAGAAYECSSSYDVDIVRHALRNGWLNKDRTILSNGFKIPAYTRNLLKLREEGFANLMPIFDDLNEIKAFADSDLTFNVGLRSRTDMQGSNNRFGMDLDQMRQAARQIDASGNLTLTTYHAMQTVSAGRGLQYQAALMRSVRTYAALKREVPSLHRFNFGGGLPERHTMDFQDWMIQTLQNIMAVCEEEGIEAPDLLIESGRYLVQNHALKLFRVHYSRMGEDGVPYYILDGSVMSNFPDAWALGDKFTVLPINGWNGAFGQARLCGLTCDHDDVYPTRSMEDVPLLMPSENVGELVIGFFDCGAYQETLGGRGGAKHCLLPEGSELIMDDSSGFGELSPETLINGQNEVCVLGNLGYGLN